MDSPGDSQPDAGWYPDPHDSGRLRYWDGGAWTPHMATPAVPPGWHEDPRRPRRRHYWNGSAWAVTESQRRPAALVFACVWAFLIAPLLAYATLVGGLGRDPASS